MQYQIRDWQCFDYDLWPMPGVGHFRGPDPRPLAAGKYVTYLGAAQTFGRFSHAPYPTLLERAGFAGVNLATSAVGPRYYLGREPLRRLANEGRCCVLQVMSGRASSNTKYHNHKWGNAMFQPVGAPADAPEISYEQMLKPLFHGERKPEARALMDEMRSNWIAEMKELISQISVPVILLWLSQRTPAYDPSIDSLDGYLGQYPHLIDAGCIEAIRPLVSSYVEIVSAVGIPVKFENRFIGGPGECLLGSKHESSNGYYPSQAMHDLAAAALAPELKNLLGDQVAAGNDSKARRKYERLGPHKRVAAALRHLRVRNAMSRAMVSCSPETSWLLDALEYSWGPRDSWAQSVNRDKGDARAGLLLVGCDSAGTVPKETLSFPQLAPEGLVVIDQFVGPSSKTVIDFYLARIDGLVPVILIDNILVLSRVDARTRVFNTFNSWLKTTVDASFTSAPPIAIANHKVPVMLSRHELDWHLDYDQYGIKGAKV